MSRPPITTGSVYHIFNRGVEKRDVFLDNKDRARFVHYLYHLNNTVTQHNITRRISMIEVQPQSLRYDPLVDIFAFVLMPNHYHLMLRERTEGGLSKFMQKLGTGYTMYFNDRYNRTSALFQGRFKYVLVTTHAQLLYLPHYIHCNPLDLKLNGSDQLGRLMTYRWTSLLDYAAIKNFPSVIHKKYIEELFGGKKQYKKDLQNVLATNPNGVMSEIIDVAIDY